MSLKNEMKALTEGVLSGGQAAQPTVPRPAHKGTAPGQLFGLTEQQRLIERELLELRRQAGGPRLIQRTKLRPSPYQTRTITPEAVEALAANLRENDLATPLTVREIAPDVFEIIAGHRRDAAFGLLERAEIPCIVVKMDDDQAERAVFFDNFFPADICDFEKYLGLLLIQARHKYTYDQLAEKSGVSKALVNLLMSFDRLPPAALDVLRKTPTLIGATAAANLAKLDAKHAGRIPEGLQMVADGRLKQVQLVDWILQKAAPVQIQPTLIRAGKKTFAKVLRRDSRITLDFTTLDDAAALEKKIAALIKEHVDSAKS